MKTALALVVVAATCGAASAATLSVPEDFATIQEAVDAAEPGDRIRVGPGSWCGATVAKPVRLEGHGKPTIVGCAAPTLDGGPLRVGFLLSAGASGAQVRGFVFDGRGVSNHNTDPLAFAVFARGADDVVIEHDVVMGSVQALTNTGGGGWQVDHNDIVDLTAFTCDGFCGGGSAIVFQQRVANAARAVGNSAEHNSISGAVPDGLDEFDLAGVVLFGQDGATASHNRLAIPENPDAAGQGVGILVSDRCCGESQPFRTSINSVLFANDGRASQIAVRVTRDADDGTGNTEGAFIAANKGVLDINGTVTRGLRGLAPARARGRLFE